MSVVAKIGSSSITDDRGVIDGAAIAKLCDEVVALRARATRCMPVSSGASPPACRASASPTSGDMATLQAFRRAGQSRLVEVYNASLCRYGLVAAQVLLDPHDFVDRHAVPPRPADIGRLLELGCVPGHQRERRVANDDLRYGDNDRSPPSWPTSVAADLLVLLTDTPGSTPPTPAATPARLITEVAADDPVLATAGGSGRAGGVGAWRAS